MPGPLPNPSARRRNAGSQFRTLPEEGRPDGEIPKLPGARSKLKATRDAWEAWWRSPMASQWSDADVAEVALMAACYDDAMRGDLKKAQEFRHWADRFGLSPKARLANRWSLPEGGKRQASDADETVVKLRVVGQ